MRENRLFLRKPHSLTNFFAMLSAASPLPTSQERWPPSWTPSVALLGTKSGSKSPSISIRTQERLSKAPHSETCPCLRWKLLSLASGWPKVWNPWPRFGLVLRTNHRTEHPRVRFFWNHEANSYSSFTDYFLKVYSPGEVTHADLIIVNAGLYWLFLECKNVIADPAKKSDFAEQATTCRANLETVLSSLPFHLPSTMDTTCAMMLAVCSHAR